MTIFDKKTKIPTDPSAAIDYVIEYMKNNISKSEISFDGFDHNPVEIVTSRKLQDNYISKRKEAIEYWWEIIDRVGIQEFKNVEALRARLAICLLYPTLENYDTLKEQVDWFDDMLIKMKVSMVT